MRKWGGEEEKNRVSSLPVGSFPSLASKSLVGGISYPTSRLRYPALWVVTGEEQPEPFWVWSDGSLGL